jgi:hypothetical protein
MAQNRARKNPQGLPVAAGDQHLLVMVGDKSTLTHLYDPKLQMHACQSGKNAGRAGMQAFEGAEPGQGEWLRNPPKLYQTTSSRITCYRCAKLAEINLKNSGGRSIIP